MKDFNKSIDGLRNLMKNMKIEKYAIENPELIDVDEHIKNLYIKILCTIIQYENEPLDMQLLFLKRIIKGMRLDASLEEYMRKALEISEEDIEEFIVTFSKKNYKYYFTLDGLILISMGNGKKANYEYFAEIIELLEINQRDLEFISLVAKSVLKQDPSYFDKAKEHVNERIAELDFAPYVFNYYVGAIVDTNVKKHYSAPHKELSSTICCPSKYKERKVVFNNLILYINKNWSFEGCEEVVFRNCIIIGNNKYFSFNRVGKIVFDSCKLKNFSNGIAKINSINSILISTTEFVECGKTEETGSCYGGMFVITGNKVDEVRIFNNKLLNCYAARKTYQSYNAVTGAFMYFSENSISKSQLIRVKDNEFIGCDCINDGYSKAALIYGFRGSKEEDNNKYTGKLQNLFG